MTSGAAPAPVAPAASAPAATAACTGAQSEQEIGLAMSRVFKRLRGIYHDALPGPDGVRLRDAAAARLAREHVDVDAFTREALRMAWDEADEEHRVRWRGSLGALLHARYLRALRDPLRYGFVVQSVATTGCNAADVRAGLTDRRTGSVATVTLRVLRTDGLWRAWDVQVDDASLVQSWRGRFTRVHRAGGVAELDRQLRKLGHRFRVEAQAH